MVLSTVHVGGPKLTVDRTIFEFVVGLWPVIAYRRKFRREVGSVRLGLDGR